MGVMCVVGVRFFTCFFMFGHNLFWFQRTSICCFSQKSVVVPQESSTHLRIIVICDVSGRKNWLYKLQKNGWSVSRSTVTLVTLAFPVFFVLRFFSFFLFFLFCVSFHFSCFFCVFKQKSQNQQKKEKTKTMKTQKKNQKKKKTQTKITNIRKIKKIKKSKKRRLNFFLESNVTRNSAAIEAPKIWKKRKTWTLKVAFRPSGVLLVAGIQ